MQRAVKESIPDDKRAEAYLVLASMDWKCSYDITEQAESKQVIKRSARAIAIVRYRKPKNETLFLNARQCATSGLENIEKAMKLGAGDGTAWSYKAYLLAEMSKFAEMAGQRELRAEYLKQADEAWARTRQLNEEKEKKARSNSPAGKP